MRRSWKHGGSRRLWRRAVIIPPMMILSLVAFCLQTVTAVVDTPSDISSDELVTLYPTPAWRDTMDSEWRVEVHGCIFEPESPDALLALLRTALGLDDAPPATSPATQPGCDEIFNARAAAFLVDHERGDTVPICYGDSVYRPPPSGANGHFRGVFRVGEIEAARLAPATQPARAARWMSIRAVTPRGDERAFSGRVALIGPEGISVVSDIDDTVKLTNVRDRDELLKNTFLRPFRAIDGMPEMYRRWEDRGDVAFHYVSSSPWQLYEPLAEFMRSTALPAGTFHLKVFRWTDETFLSLFAAPDDHKSREIESLIQRFPKRRFVLVGDSGERDPEIYASVARRHPDNVKAILIRNVTQEPAEAPRYKRTFKELPRERWRIFSQPAELADWNP